MKKAPKSVQLPTILGAVAEVALVFVIFLLSKLVVTLSLAAWGITSFSEFTSRQGAVLFSYILGGLLTVAAVWVVLKYQKKGPAFLRLLRPGAGVFGYAAGGYVVYFVALIVALTFISVVFPDVNLKEAQNLGISKEQNGLALIPVFLALVVAPAFTEEVLFRGYLYQRLKHHRVVPVVSAVITSTLFGFFHGQLNIAIDTFILSMTMIYFLEKTNNLWVAITMHAIKNSVAFVGLFLLK